MGKTTKYTERRFLGKTTEFESKEEQRHEQKHLKAYLKGFERFRHGYKYTEVKDKDGEVVKVRDTEGNLVPKMKVSRDPWGNLVPLWFPVKQEVIIDEEKRKLLTGK